MHLPLPLALAFSLSDKVKQEKQRGKQGILIRGSEEATVQKGQITEDLNIHTSLFKHHSYQTTVRKRTESSFVLTK